MASYTLQQALALGFKIGHYKPLSRRHVLWNKFLWKLALLFGQRLSFEGITPQRLPNQHIDIHLDDVNLIDVSEEERAFVEQPLAQPPRPLGSNLNHYVELASQYGHCH